jgi:hypothetical protein
MHLSLTFHRFTMPRKETRMSTASEHAGQAALSICEALLLAMNDRGVLPEHEIVGVLRDAARPTRTQSARTWRSERHRGRRGLDQRDHRWRKLSSTLVKSSFVEQCGSSYGYSIDWKAKKIFFETLLQNPR